MISRDTRSVLVARLSVGTAGCLPSSGPTTANGSCPGLSSWTRTRDTVRREVLEETGVTVEPGQLTGVYKNMRLGVVSLVFRCRSVWGTAQPTAEATEVAWLDSTQVTGRMAEAFAIRLTDALEAD